MVEIYDSSLQEAQAEFKTVELGEFDPEYFATIRAEYDWLATEHPDFCTNCRYFTVYGDEEPLGIAGVYDTEDDKNIAHIHIERRFRGMGLSKRFHDLLLTNNNLEYLTITVDLDNQASLRAAEKIEAERVSDASYEKAYHKAKFIYSVGDKT